MNVRNEIKAQIVRSVSNLSAKLQRESIRYKEVVELADALGYDLIWQKRRER